MENNNFDKKPKSFNPEALKSQLNAEQQALLGRLLADKDAREKFLSSAEAQTILKMLKKM